MFNKDKAPRFHSKVEFNDKGIAIFAFINPNPNDNTPIRFYLLKDDSQHAWIISMPELMIKELFRMQWRKFKPTSDNRILLGHLLKLLARMRLSIDPRDVVTNR